MAIPAAASWAQSWVEASAVEEAAANTLNRECDEAQSHGADDAGDQVDTDDVERIVKAPAELEADGQGGSRTGDQAEAEGADRADVGAGRGDGDQAGNHTGGGTERGRVTVADAFRDEPAEHGRCGGCEGVDPDQAALLRRRCCAAVEAEPAEPQDRGTEHHERDVVRAVVGVLAEALAVADDQHEDQRGDTGVDVDHCAAGEVNRRAEGLADCAFRAEQPAAPDHVGQRAVHQRDPDRDEDGPGAELGAVSDRAADQGDGDDGEGGRVADLDESVRSVDALQPEGGERVARPSA